ncbi:MAG: hypothetical protein ACXV8U_12900 [Methylobacter sp.]
MTDNKKAAGVGKPEAALTTFSFYNRYFNRIPKHLKTAVYRLAPWLFFLGMLYG